MKIIYGGNEVTSKYPNWCTLYTDWSGLGGYGIKIRYSQAPYIIEESRKSPYSTNSTAGELHAILKGIEICKDTWQDLAGIGVKSDNQQAIKIVTYNAPVPQNEELAELQKWIRFTLEDIRIRPSWVKAHQDPSTSTQAYMNDVVDKLSRKTLVK